MSHSRLTGPLYVHFDGDECDRLRAAIALTVPAQEPKCEDCGHPPSHHLDSAGCACGCMERFTVPAPPEIEATVDSIVERYGDALNALAAPPEIDEERLARALARVFPQPPWIGEPMENEAHRIAADYRALASEETPG